MTAYAILRIYSLSQSHLRVCETRADRPRNALLTAREGLGSVFCQSSVLCQACRWQNTFPTCQAMWHFGSIFGWLFWWLRYSFLRSVCKTGRPVWCLWAIRRTAWCVSCVQSEWCFRVQCQHIRPVSFSSPTLPALPTLALGVLDSISEKMLILKMKKNGGGSLIGFLKCRSVGRLGGSNFTENLRSFLRVIGGREGIWLKYRRFRQMWLRSPAKITRTFGKFCLSSGSEVWD